MLNFASFFLYFFFFLDLARVNPMRIALVQK